MQTKWANQCQFHSFIFTVAMMITVAMMMIVVIMMMVIVVLGMFVIMMTIVVIMMMAIVVLGGQQYRTDCLSHLPSNLLSATAVHIHYLGSCRHIIIMSSSLLSSCHHHSCHHDIITLVVILKAGKDEIKRPLESRAQTFSIAFFIFNTHVVDNIVNILLSSECGWGLSCHAM